jgi:hypothetical protein
VIRTRAPRAAALALALALPLGLVACSDADDSAEVVSEGSASDPSETTEGTDETGDSTTTEGSDASTTTTDGADTTTTEDGGGRASGDLVDALLTVDDLPAGHTQDGEDVVDDSTMSDDDPLCDGETATFPQPVEEVERQFQGEDFSSLVGSFAGRFSGDEAEDGLAFYRSELERCGGVADDDLSYEHRELAGIGDEALVITLSDPQDLDVGTATVYFARVDDVLVGVSVFAEDPAAIDGEALLALSVDRL